MKTRMEIDAELQRLEHEVLPRILRECEPSDVMEEFAGEAEHLVENGPVEHLDHIHATISCMLAAAGLIPGDNEGESCTAS